MTADRAGVRRIARLARLQVSDAELERLTDDLNRILGHVDKLGSLKPSAASATDERGEDVPSTRDSTRVDSDVPADALSDPPSAFAPDWRESFFVVPPPPGVQRGKDGE